MTMPKVPHARTPAEVARDEDEVKSAANPAIGDGKGNVQTKDALPDVEVTEEDKKYVRTTYKNLFTHESNIRKATTALGETLFKLLDRATERSTTVNEAGEKVANLKMALAYVMVWTAEGEKEWQRRDLQDRIDTHEVEKGTSELRPMTAISNTYLTYKSNMLAGLKAGINPHEPLPLLEGEDKQLPKFSTWNDYRKAATEAVRAARAPRQAGTTGKTTVTQLKAVQAKMSPNCQAMWNHLGETIAQVSFEIQDKEFEPLLKLWANTAAGLVAGIQSKELIARGEPPLKTGAIAQATDDNGNVPETKPLVEPIAGVSVTLETPPAPPAEESSAVRAPARKRR